MSSYPVLLSVSVVTHQISEKSQEGQIKTLMEKIKLYEYECVYLCDVFK